MKMSVLRTAYILTFVLASALLWQDCCSQGNPRRRPRNRNTAQRNEGLPTDLQQAYLSAVDGEQQTPSSNPREGIRPTSSDNWWQDLAPSTPAPETVECTIEVVMISRQGGRCTRLGGAFMPYICQSGHLFDFQSECQQIIQARNENQPNVEP